MAQQAGQAAGEIIDAATGKKASTALVGAMSSGVVADTQYTAVSAMRLGGHPHMVQIGELTSLLATEEIKKMLAGNAAMAKKYQELVVDDAEPLVTTMQRLLAAMHGTHPDPNRMRMMRMYNPDVETIRSYTKMLVRGQNNMDVTEIIAEVQIILDTAYAGNPTLHGDIQDRTAAGGRLCALVDAMNRGNAIVEPAEAVRELVRNLAAYLAKNAMAETIKMSALQKKFKVSAQSNAAKGNKEEKGKSKQTATTPNPQQQQAQHQQPLQQQQQQGQGQQAQGAAAAAAAAARAKPYCVMHGAGRHATEACQTLAALRAKNGHPGPVQLGFCVGCGEGTHSWIGCRENAFARRPQ